MRGNRWHIVEGGRENEARVPAGRLVKQQRSSSTDGRPRGLARRDADGLIEFHPSQRFSFRIADATIQPGRGLKALASRPA